MRHNTQFDANGKLEAVAIETATCKLEIGESFVRIWRSGIAYDHFLFGVRPGDNYIEISLPTLPSTYTTPETKRK